MQGMLLLWLSECGKRDVEILGRIEIGILDAEVAVRI